MPVSGRFIVPDDPTLSEGAADDVTVSLKDSLPLGLFVVGGWVGVIVTFPWLVGLVEFWSDTAPA